jgi:hypothetical protein
MLFDSALRQQPRVCPLLLRGEMDYIEWESPAER